MNSKLQPPEVCRAHRRKNEDVEIIALGLERGRILEDLNVWQTEKFKTAQNGSKTYIY